PAAAPPGRSGPLAARRDTRLATLSPSFRSRRLRRPAAQAPSLLGGIPASRRSVRPFEQVHRAHAATTHEVRERDAGAVDLTPRRFAAQLHHRFVHLRQAGRPARVAARNETAVGVEGETTARPCLALL